MRSRTELALCLIQLHTGQRQERGAALPAPESLKAPLPLPHQRSPPFSRGCPSQKADPPGGASISEVGQGHKTQGTEAERQQAKTRSWEEAGKGRFSQAMLTIALSGDRRLKKPFAPNFWETAASVDLGASAFPSWEPALATSSAEAHHGVRHGAGTRGTTGAPESAASGEASADRGSAATPSRLNTTSAPAPKPPPLSSAPGRSPPQLTGCYYSL